MNTQENNKIDSFYTTPPYNTILSCIKQGQANAVHLEELILLTGIESRILRKQIEFLRRSGIPIASNKNGYYIPADLYEIRAYINCEQNRAQSILTTLETARQLEQKMTEAE